MNTHHHYLAVLVDNHKLCFPITFVRQATGAADLLPIPMQTFALMGMLNISERLIPVLSCHQLLGLGQKPLQPEHRFLILQNATCKPDSSHHEFEFALHVDEIAGLLIGDECIVEKILLPEGENRLSFTLVSHKGEKFWFFEPDEMLSGVDINLLDQLATTF